jgi:hypothetical protein
MTILGKHTVAEIRDLMATIDFRIKAVFSLIAKKNGDPLAFTPGHPGISSNNIAAWNVWLTNWRQIQDKVSIVLTALMISNPLVGADTQPAEDQWTRIRCAINRSCDDSHTDPGDMQSIIIAIQIEGGESIDERNRPEPKAGDPDFDALLKVDAAIKAGEKAKADVERAGKSALTSNTGIAIIGTIIIVGGVYAYIMRPR